MSVQELTKNKKYRIDIPISYNGNSRKRYLETFYGTHKQAKDRHDMLKSQFKNKPYIINNKIKVQELMNDWLESSKMKWSPKTYNANTYWVKNVNKHIGSIRLKDLNVKTLENFYKELKEKTTLADNTIRHHYAVINAALNKAVKWGFIERNPNSLVEKPKAEKKEIEFYTPSEVEKLLIALKSESLKYEALIRLAIDSGARRGEITGLTWEDIDFETQTITINKTTQYLKSLGVYEKGTKNSSSNRNFRLSDSTIRALIEYRNEQLEIKSKLGNKWQGSKRIFTTDYGADMHPDTPSKILDTIIKRHNLKRITFHGLRHTSISLQIYQGYQPQVISRRAGHSNVIVTDAVYSHVTKEYFETVSYGMNKFLDI